MPVQIWLQSTEKRILTRVPVETAEGKISPSSISEQSAVLAGNFYYSTQNNR